MNEAQQIDQLHFLVIHKMETQPKKYKRNKIMITFHLYLRSTFFQNLSIYLMSIQNVPIQAYIESTDNKSLLEPIYIWHSFWCTKIGVNRITKMSTVILLLELYWDMALSMFSSKRCMLGPLTHTKMNELCVCGGGTITSFSKHKIFRHRSFCYSMLQQTLVVVVVIYCRALIKQYKHEM